MNNNAISDSSLLTVPPMWLESISIAWKSYTSKKQKKSDEKKWSVEWQFLKKNELTFSQIFVWRENTILMLRCGGIE